MNFAALETEQRPAIIPLEFTTEFVPDPEAPSQMIGRDRVRWAKKGTSNGATTSDWVDRLQKGSIEWPVLEPYYDAWKKNQDAPVDGTPLDAWPGLTPQQAKVLRDHKLYSVEDVAEASDGALAKIGLPGMRTLKMRAKAFVEAAQNRSEVADELAKRDSQIEQLQNQLADALSAIQEIRDQDQANGETAPKRGPGRPRKDA